MNAHTGLGRTIGQRQRNSLHPAVKAHVLGVRHGEDGSEPLACREVGELVADPVLQEGCTLRSELGFEQLACGDEGEFRSMMAQAVEPFPGFVRADLREILQAHCFGKTYEEGIG